MSRLPWHNGHLGISAPSPGETQIGSKPVRRQISLGKTKNTLLVGNHITRSTKAVISATRLARYVAGPDLTLWKLLDRIERKDGAWLTGSVTIYLPATNLVLSGC
jgi:hypothetical protein